MSERREYRYRCVTVKTIDYGDGPACPAVAIATLSVIPDGSHWQDRPATIDIRVPVGERPGALWALTLEKLP